jgi:glycyl-tRNA synthetase
VGLLVQEKLGSMLDKSKRVESMVEPLASALALDEASLATARQAAPLATADLATSVVKEFTSLAGVMGRHYALREGQPVPVSGQPFPFHDGWIEFLVAKKREGLILVV